MKLKLFSVFIFLSFFISFLSAAPPTEGEKTLPCDPPAKITSAASANGKTLNVRWTVDEVPSVYQLQYRSGLDSNWIYYDTKISFTIPADTNRIMELNDLIPCARYQLRVRKRCSSGDSDWRTSDNYTLLPCAADCPKPATFTGIISSNDTIATFKWTLTSTVSNKAVLTIVSDDGSFKKIINTTESSAVVNLPRCKKISAYLQIQCTDQLSEGLAVYLQTTGCTTASCAIPGNIRTKDMYQDNVIIAWSGTAAKYYIDYRLLADSLNPTAWKRDSAITTNITISHLKLCTYYQMRVFSVCDGAVSLPSEIIIKTDGCAMPVCEKPLSFQVQPGDGSVTLTYKFPAGVTEGILTLHGKDNNYIHDTTVTGSTLTLLGLPRCKSFVIFLQSKCTNAILSEVTDANYFVTKGCDGTSLSCAAPTNAIWSDTNGFNDLKWVGNATKYYVEYALNDGGAPPASAYKRDSTTQNYYVFKNIECGASYSYHVTAVCPSGVSEPTPTGFFKAVCGFSCPKPTALKVVGTDGSAIMSWQVPAGDSVNITIAATDTVYKKVITVSGSTYTLSGLPRCKHFAAYIQTKCSNNNVSDYAEVVNFETTGCAPPPPNTCHRPIAFKGAAQDTTAYFGWATEIGENNLVLTVVSSDSTYKKVIPVTGFSYTLIGLPHCKKFTATLQNKCPNGVLSDALIIDFTTGGCTAECGTPAQITVVSADSTHAAIKWSSVGATKYYIEYKTDSSAVWKRDSTTATTFTLSNLIRCRLYLARVSAACAVGISRPTSTVHFVTSGCMVSTCKIPAGLDADIAHDTAVNFMWAGVDSGNYSIQYRIATDANVVWTTVKTTHPNYFLVGLKRCQVYVWQVRRICGTDTTAWSAPAKFETTGCAVGIGSAVCPKIQEISVKFTVDSVVVYWASFSPRPFINYQIQYRKATDATWSAEINTTLPYYIFKNLMACTNYVARVRVQCDNSGANFGDWAEVHFKQSGTNCLRGDNSGFVGTATSSQVIVSPNPSSENPTVIFKLEQQAPVRIDIVNINGSVVSQWNAGILQAGDYAHTFEQYEILPTGLYFVAFRIEGNATRTIKWLKN